MNRPQLGPATERLIEQLTQELEPVRPMPGLRWPAAALTLSWLLIAAPLAIWPGPRAIQNPGFLPTFSVMALLAVGGAWASLALCMPGRESAARTGTLLCAAGLVGIGLLSVAEGFPPAKLSYLADTLWHDWICVGIATGLALPLWAIILSFGRRAWIARHTAVALTAGVGSVAAGAMLVHTLCDEGCARHALGSHALAPIWGTSLLLLPALYALRRRD